MRTSIKGKKFTAGYREHELKLLGDFYKERHPPIIWVQTGHQLIPGIIDITIFKLKGSRKEAVIIEKIVKGLDEKWRLTRRSKDINNHVMTHYPKDFNSKIKAINYMKLHLITQ